MEETKKKTPNTTITRNTAQFSDMTDNIYETVALLTKRANQISIEEKREIHKKIEEYASGSDMLDEYFENRDQIEAIRGFEQQPKPVLKATEEYLEHELYYRNPAKEDQEQRKMEEMENELIADKQ